MALDQISLTGPQLGRIDHLFLTIRDTYAKRATIVFTNGKSDDRWLDKSPATPGQTLIKDVRVDAARKECSAVCLIDLYATLVKSSESSRSRRGSRNGPDPLAFRRTTVLAVVHELLHAAQGWQLGQAFEREYVEEAESSIVRAYDAARARNELPIVSPYLENAFERGAFDFVSRWYDTHLVEMNDGKFDFLLPRTTMRGVFPDFPGAFP
jgi:hypothetical protein